MPDTARFYIDLPLENLDEIEELLQDQGVEFDQCNNMVCLPRDNLMDSIFTGREGQEALEKVRHHLQDHKVPHNLPTYFYDMTPWQRRDFLEFVTLHVAWDNDFSPDTMEVSQQQLAALLEQFPAGGPA